MEELSDLSQDYFYLMDSGIVLLNAKATLALMKKSGWNPEREIFPEGGPSHYDLYGSMLTCFGEEASCPDPELSGLSRDDAGARH